MSTIVLNMENDLYPINLFRSKTRRSLLALFFTNPAGRFYVRQLQSMLGVSVGSLHRELKSLEAAGVLKSEAQANARFYSANQDYVLYSELATMVAKTLGVEGALRAGLSDLSGVSVAFVYGSFASATQTARSDIDLMVIGRFSETALNRQLQALEKELNREINYVAVTPDELRQSFAKKEPFISTVISEPKIFLIGDEHEFRAMAG